MGEFRSGAKPLSQSELNHHMSSKPALSALSALVPFLVAACASSTDPGSQQADLVCTRETPTGSSIPITKCRTKEQIEQELAAARATGEDIGRARTGLRGPTGK